ncbi:hypothetical protein [Frischella perrara]|nr:hypothetical protein [Frischella perrara]
MMRKFMLKKYCILLAVLFFIPICFANSIPEKDVKTLELAGVKLGMTESELIQLFKNKYQLADTDITIKEQKMKLPPSKPEEQSTIIGTLKTYKVTLDPNKSVTLIVRLEEDIMHDPVQIVVFGIDQMIPYSSEAEQHEYEALVKKYGKEQSKNFMGDKMWKFTVDDVNSSNNILFFSSSEDGTIDISIVTDQYRKQKIK